MKGCVRGAAVAVAVAAVAVVAASPAAAQDGLARKLERAVSGDAANRHLRAFQRIADTNRGNRAAGTSGHVASAEYVKQRLESAGYQVELQPFSYADFEVLAERARITAPEARDLRALMSRFSPSTPAGGVTGQVVTVPADATPGCEASDYAGASYTGKIVVLKTAGCSAVTKANTAADAGAILVLLDYDYQPIASWAFRGSVPDGQARIPVATLSRAEAEPLAAQAAQETVTMTVELRGQAKTTTTHNVIAETPTGRADNVVLAGGHLDSVTEGPGINDNGSSSAMLLETALALAPNWNRVRNKVRFAWWSAEERGLLGSAAYVNSLSFERQLDIALYLNFDMIGSPNFARMVYDGDDSDRTGSGPGPYGSAQIERVFTDYFADRGLPTVGRDFDGRSDYGSFIRVGIPSGGATSGSNLIKTPAWTQAFGGVTGLPTDVCYHQPCDNLGNVNRTIFDEIGDGMAWAIGWLARDTSEVNGEQSRGERAELRAAAAH